MKFKKIIYDELNAKAKEMYNFQKVSAKLADYGFTTMWLNNDWQGADFIAIHIDGVTDLKVQLKGRFSFDKKYIGKDIYLCFIDDGDVYLYPHDSVLNKMEKSFSGKLWQEEGIRSWPQLTKAHKQLLSPFLL